MQTILKGCFATHFTKPPLIRISNSRFEALNEKKKDSETHIYVHGYAFTCKVAEEHILDNKELQITYSASFNMGI